MFALCGGNFGETMNAHNAILSRIETSAPNSGMMPPALQAGILRSAVWRLFDILTAGTILIVALPFLLCLALVLYIADPGPLFFVHRRIGHRGRPFGCIKFRSMKRDGDQLLRDYLDHNPQARREWAETHKLRRDPRITPIGAIVRRLSLDEFPQLWNVLRGDMSIVGPRPIVEAEIVRYGRFFEYYCLVKPGLTGLWQVSGRSDTSYRERVQLDVSYVLRKSLILDAWLLLKTVPAVVFSRGSY